MADLTACYFCGDATVEEYPVIPPRMDPPEDAQRTVALCPDCHDKLGAVLEAVVGFVGDRPAGGETATGGSGPASGTTGGEPATGGSDVWFETPGGRGEGVTGSDEGAGEGVTGGDEGVTGSDEGVTGSDEGVTGRDEEVTGGDAPETGGGGPVPDSYRKVLRLLQNREFPVERAEFETVAANAYELSPGEVGAALDAAVDRGLIAEEDGTLRRPE